MLHRARQVWTRCPRRRLFSVTLHTGRFFKIFIRPTLKSFKHGVVKAKVEDLDVQIAGWERNFCYLTVLTGVLLVCGAQSFSDYWRPRISYRGLPLATLGR